MKTFEGLQHGDKLRCVTREDFAEIVIWRGEMYLAGESDMWPISEFNPADWELV